MIVTSYKEMFLNSMQQFSNRKCLFINYKKARSHSVSASIAEQPINWTMNQSSTWVIHTNDLSCDCAINVSNLSGECAVQLSDLSGECVVLVNMNDSYTFQIVDYFTLMRNT